MTNVVNQADTVELELEEDLLPADDVAGAAQGQWTYATYAKLPDDGKRYEIIEGVLYQMPAPETNHQRINNWIAYYLTTYVQIAGPGSVLSAPCDVKFDEDNTVQPDVIVVLNENKGIITKNNIVGAPDLLIEVSSPSTARHDRNRKFELYARFGVKEYWIVKPSRKTIEIFVLQQGSYVSKKIYQKDDILESTIIPNLPIKAAQFFA